MSSLLRAAIILMVLISAQAYAKGDAAAGQAKSAICAACHGVDGNSMVATWPKLAGQHEQYLVRQVELIKSGARPVPEMMGITPGLSDQDIEDLAAYRDNLSRFVFRSGMLMKPVFERAARDPRRLVYAEGESMRVLRAIQALLDDGIIARPLLLGRPGLIEATIRDMGLHIAPGKDFDVLDPSSNPNYEQDWRDYHRIMERKSVSPADARATILTRTTALATLLLHRGDVDGMIAGVNGGFHEHLNFVRNVIGLASGLADLSAINLLIGHAACRPLSPEPLAFLIQIAVLLAAFSFSQSKVTPMPGVSGAIAK